MKVYKDPIVAWLEKKAAAAVHESYVENYEKLNGPNKLWVNWNIGNLFSNLLCDFIEPRKNYMVGNSLPFGSFLGSLETRWPDLPKDKIKELQERLQSDPSFDKTAFCAVVNGAADELKRIAQNIHKVEDCGEKETCFWLR